MTSTSVLCGTLHAAAPALSSLRATTTSRRRRHPRPTRLGRRVVGGDTDAEGDDVAASAAPPAASSPTRRDTLRLAAVAAAAALAPLAPVLVTPALAADTVATPFDGVPNERWVNIPVETRLPASWAPRPGQRMKQSKFMLYTDTYGPNYRYTTALPRYVDADGAVVANSIAVLVQSRGGQDAITDLGPQSGIDAPKAFGIETDDIALAEQVSASKRTDGGKQTYYQWELLCPGGSHVLISACISGGGLYVLSVEASGEQWSRQSTALKEVLTNFRVPVTSEATTDISDRIYNNASSGGFD